MPTPDLDTLDIHSTSLYQRRGYPWAEWDLLRREAPVFWYEREDIAPFYAITRHADVLTISRRSDVFVNSRRLRLQTIEEDQRQTWFTRMRIAQRGWDPDEPSDFILMDDPRHRAFRMVTARRFTPAALRRLEPRLRELSQRFAAELDALLERSAKSGEAFDFVRAFSQKLPLAAIGEMMGLPDGDWMRLKQLTNVMIGAPEDDFFRAGEDRNLGRVRAVEEMTDYMVRLIHDRKAKGAPNDDITDAIVRGEVDGEPLTEQQLAGYLFVILAAGNETTQNAITGGVHALLDHPDQLGRLCREPSEALIVSCAEEILRWTSPVLQFARTATEDFELHGTTIAAGQDVGMWYPSANRDETVFERPYAFDIGRRPNPHLAFGGYGAHFCLGANLARWELRAALRALVPVLPKLASAGGPERCDNLHVAAIHRLPVRAAA